MLWRCRSRKPDRMMRISRIVVTWLVAFALWEQARLGLLATVVSRETNVGVITTVNYQRSYDRTGRTLVSQRVRHDSMETHRPFIAARPAADFGRLGYVENVGRDRS